MNKIFTADSYVLKFGKFKNFKALDIAKIKTVDKNNEEKPTGLLYLQWLVTQEWFKHKDTIQEILNKEGVQVIEVIPVEEKSEKVEKVIRKKKDTKEKETNLVKINQVSKTLNFDE